MKSNALSHSCGVWSARGRSQIKSMTARVVAISGLARWNQTCPAEIR